MFTQAFLFLALLNQRIGGFQPSYLQPRRHGAVNAGHTSLSLEDRRDLWPLAAELRSKTRRLSFGVNSNSPEALDPPVIEAATVQQPSQSLLDRATQSASTAAVGLFLCTVLLSGSLTPAAADASSDDYMLSDPVKTVIANLKDSQGNVQQSFDAYKKLGDIIIEGAGVGGEIDYKGVQLNRGYVADEDTSIYNPGLTLLTETEKERLVEAVVANRNAGMGQPNWKEENQLAFEFLREKLDPYHMQELRGYLGILPFWGAFVYLAVLAVQQFARDLFPVAYIAGALAVFIPIVALVAFGP